MTREVPGLVGARQARPDAYAKVTGAARYTADIAVPGMIYGKIKRSPIAHARVVRVDTARAEALEGVLAVLTPADVPSVRHAGAPDPRREDLREDQQILPEHVRFVGDGLAAVAARSPEIATEALDRIDVTYEPLPVVLGVERAREPDAPRLHGTPDNQVMPPLVVCAGDVEAGLTEADFVVRERYQMGRPVSCYMEPNACLCQPEADGSLTMWSSTQCPFMVRGILSEVLGLDPERIHVIVEHMGGGFGAKQDIYQHEFLCALLAMRTGRPVKMEYTRTEVFLAGRTRHPVCVELEHGVKHDGTLTARRATYTADSGAYASHGPGITSVGTEDLASLYRCSGRYYIEGHCVYTNAPIAGAYRGYGAVQAYFALDVQIDEIAIRLGIDPVAFRLANAVREGDHTSGGHRLQGDGLRQCLRAGAEAVGWAKRWRPPADKRGRVRHGLGVGTQMHCGGAYPFYEEVSRVRLRLEDSGEVVLETGMLDIGTGALTALAQIAAFELGVPMAQLRLRTGTTHGVPFDNGAFASRTTHTGGRAAQRAGRALKGKLVDLVARRLGQPSAELDLRRGAIVRRADGAVMLTLSELAREIDEPEQASVLVEHHAKKSYSYAAHFVDLSVDTETGEITVHRVTAVHEVGRAINPNGIEGQIEGGIQQGLGHSLTEDLVLDPVTGRPLNPGFVDYKMPLSVDMPVIDSIILESPGTSGPYGAKGIGEDPIIPIGPAVANAVTNAIGVRMRALPITAECVLEALHRLGQ
ncbi:MAG: molybdopterin cofactor-binding domain-containing protein [Myxococcota bacterium]